LIVAPLLIRSLIRLAHRSGASDAEIARLLPGDELVPEATDVVDRAVTLSATPEQVWPWLVQLGKQRAGWYFPAWIEHTMLPRRGRGLRQIAPAFQQVAVGNEVPDYGPGQPVLRAMTVEPNRALVYLSLRDKRHNHRWPTDAGSASIVAFSWALILTEQGASTRLHIRLRMRLTGSKLPVAAFGGLFDWLTVRLLFSGLRERLSVPEQGPGGRRR
jgi:hypothetical protein